MADTKEDKSVRAKRKRLKKQGKSGIVIKKSKEGGFTAWCKAQGFDGVTAECIAKGKASKDARIRRKATFAANARKFKH